MNTSLPQQNSNPANISLPQNDSNPALRTQQLDGQRQKYVYNHTYLPEGIPMVDQVPPEEESFRKFDWVRDAISLLLRIQANQALQDIGEFSSAGRLRRYIKLTRLLNNPQKAGFLQWLLLKLLPLIQWVLKFFRQSSSQTSDGSGYPSLGVEKQVKALINEVTVERSHPIPEKSLATKTQEMLSQSDKQSFEDYRKLFRVYDDLFQIIYLPCIRDHFQEDRAFAAQRVAGANPLVIQQAKTLPEKFPLTAAQYQAVMGEQDSLEVAAQEGRLYLADYAVLEGVKTSAIPNAQKYLCAPIALFAVPKTGGRSLIPVAIQCEQKPGPQNPIFTPPPCGTPQTERWSWLIAKTIVQIADGNYHELISHLGRTHLLLEIFIVATQRQLAPNHPLSVLLLPHFEGTLFINNAARRGLINPGGTVDSVLSGTLAESLRITAKSILGYPFSFNDSMVPQTFIARGVANSEQLPDYPYRDDALLIWDAIHTWVSDYLTLYYLSDQDVIADTELQAWLMELIAQDGGRITHIGETDASQGPPSIRTRAYLIDVATLLIFTGSAQHAAVNFPQTTFMTYAPNLPLAGYRPAPTSATGATEADYFNLLPSLAQAETQMNMTYPLGSLYYTKLGNYGENYFVDPKVQEPLSKFQAQLNHIEVVIDDRNATRPTFYDFLHPSKIPQSTNI